ncbi:hypothetical protein B5M47_00465 [candidate division CPR3 bacterium 4484_211]|uniref:3'-phosphate/5'-hydroxy nucleic acid ligase n=1 Tax=candidate division CPR3 bacterium 4484_211 TaxID=1968527 RepID=A0A1W9NZA0_UNCC3|nr:MAG: hypothetical protein B5M47_00465 [candidate division CPR3 bacterium 4484_211]
MEVITETRVPLYIFANSSSIEPDCLRQAKDIANLEPAFHHVALMPDAHVGYGMPIGGILALKGHICPNAVGVDIGCGMVFTPTNLTAREIAKKDLEKLVQQIMRDIPTGFNIHKKPKTAPPFLQNPKLPSVLEKEIDRALKSLGTLGGGNHFIDIQKDQEGKIALMIHSGSRHFGLSIAKYYHQKAREICQKKNIDLPTPDLAYLESDSTLGQEYIRAMNLAMQYAKENRRQLMEATKKAVKEIFPQAKFGQELNAHHNYAALETHFGEKVWVHRKGAIRAGEKDPVIVPGSMTTHSYVGVGLGNPDSFNSCAHGAGRKLGRREAKRRYRVEEILKDIEEQGVILGKIKKGDIAEESRFSYKNIEEVIENQKDLAKMEIQLTPLASIIG